MYPELNNQSLELSNVELLKETVDQLIKDFGFVNIQIIFSGNAQNAYNELCEQVRPHIAALFKNNMQQLYNLLYRIDLSEAQIKKALNLQSDRLFEDIITDLILKRELQKVVTRKQFKQGTTN